MVKYTKDILPSRKQLIQQESEQLAQGLSGGWI